MRTIPIRRLVVICLFVFSTAAFAQGSGEKRWIVMFHQQSSIPNGIAADIERAGGAVLAEIAEIGALAATSSNPDFAANIARNHKVAHVVEDISIPMIPNAAALRAQAFDET